MSRNFRSMAGGNIWNPTKDAEGNKKAAPEKTDFLEGYYLRVEENQGQDKNSNLYTLVTEKKDQVQYWGSAVLNDQMTNVPVGTFVRIKWLGLQQPKKAGGREYHGWEVLVDDSDRLTPEQLSHYGIGSAGGSIVTETTKAATATVSESDDDDLPF